MRTLVLPAALCSGGLTCWDPGAYCLLQAFEEVTQDPSMGTAVDDNSQLLGDMPTSAFS